MQAKLITPVLALLALVATAPAQSYSGRLLVSINTESGGGLSVVDIDKPWPVVPNAAPAGASSVLRRFDDTLYVIDRAQRTIDARDPKTLALLASFRFDDGTAPTDILLVNPRMALVTDYNGTRLLWLDTWTGQVSPGLDLSQYADADGRPDMAMMERVGKRVYVQLQRFDRYTFTDHGALLAVVELPTLSGGTLSPARIAGTIPLRGMRPFFKMQSDAAGATLWLSAPGGNDDWGYADRGIEEIDLRAGRSLGFVITEPQFGGDLGPFVMVDEDKGFAVVHTSYVPSTHLRVFDRHVGQIAELHVSTAGRIDVIAHDPVTRQIFFGIPEVASAAVGGSDGALLVFDADTNEQLSGSIGVGGEPFDMLVVR